MSDKAEEAMSDNGTLNDHVAATELKTPEASQDGARRKQEASRVLFITYIVAGTCQACFFVYNSLLPYLCKQYGLNPVHLGYMQSTAALIQLLISPMIGRYGDKQGARAVLILSALSTATGHVTMGLATGVPMIIMSRFSTVAQDIRLGAQIMVSDLVEGKERGVAMGKLVLPMSLGMFLGPALGGQLARIFGGQTCLLITCTAPMLCVLVMLKFLPKESKMAPAKHQGAASGVEKKSLRSLVKDKTVLLLVIVKILLAVPLMTFAQNIGVIGMTVLKLTPQYNGLILSYNGVLGMVISGFALGRLSKRLGEDRLFRVAPFLLILGYALLSQMSSVWSLLLVLIPWNLGGAILDNQIVARLTRAAPPSDTGSMVGLNAALFQFSRIVAPLLGGVLIQQFGTPAIGYLGVTVSALLASVVYLGV